MAYYLIFETFKLDMHTICHTTTKVGVTFPAFVYASETSFRCNVILFFTAVLFVSNRIKFEALLKFLMACRYKPLHEAVRTNRKLVVEDLLKNGADINAQDDRGTTALHIAVENDNLEMVELLLELGSATNLEGKYANIPLHISSANGSNEITQLLIKYGSDVNRRNHYGESPLHVAVKYNNKNIVEILLNESAQVDTQDFYGDTVLHSCVRENSRDILELLLEYGADIITTNREAYTAFDIALQRGEVSMMHMLLPRLLIKKSETDQVNELYKSFHVKDDLKFHLKECLEELQRMKECKIFESNISFSDLLTKSVRQIEKCAGNDSIKEVLESGECCSKFPIYTGIMRRNFERALRRKYLLENCYVVFCHEVKEDLPLLCLEEIFGHFTDYELAQFRVS